MTEWQIGFMAGLLGLAVSFLWNLIKLLRQTNEHLWQVRGHLERIRERLEVTTDSVHAIKIDAERLAKQRRD